MLNRELVVLIGHQVNQPEVHVTVFPQTVVDVSRPGAAKLRPEAAKPPTGETPSQGSRGSRVEMEIFLPDNHRPSLGVFVDLPFALQNIEELTNVGVFVVAKVGSCSNPPTVFVELDHFMPPTFVRVERLFDMKKNEPRSSCLGTLSFDLQTHRDQVGLLADRRRDHHHFVAEIPHLFFLFEELSNGHAFELVVGLHQLLAPLTPNQHGLENVERDQDGHETTLQELQHIGRHECSVDQSEVSTQGQRERLPPPHHRSSHVVETDGGDEHRSSHSNAVSSCECSTGPENQDQSDASVHQHRVDLRHVDLPAMLRGGMLDGQPGQKPQRDSLLAKRVRPRDERLRGDHRSGSRQKHQPQLKDLDMRDHREEDIPLFDVLTGKQHRPLAEVVEQQCHLGKAPSPANRTSTEVAHIRVERFPSRNAEGDRPESQQGGVETMLFQERVGPVRVDRLEHLRSSRDLVEAESSDDQEPDDHDRPKSPPDLLSPIFLEGKQPHQNRQSQQKNDPLDLESTKRHRGLEEGMNDLKPLHGGEHRNRRRDHAITENQRRSEDQQQSQDTEPLAISFRLAQESLESKDTALTFIGSLKHVDDILDRHDAGQRPKEEGHHAEDVSLVDSQLLVNAISLLFEEALLDSVQHRGADVAVYDAESTKSNTHQSLKAQFLGMAAMSGLNVGRHLLVSQKPSEICSEELQYTKRHT